MISLIISESIAKDIRVNKANKVRVAIYGAGNAGAQLAASLRLTGSHIIKCFIDDSPYLWNRELNGIQTGNT